MVGAQLGRCRATRPDKNGRNRFRRQSGPVSALLNLLELRAGDDEDTWIGPASGPDGKRAYGGQFVAQSLAAARRTVDAGRSPTNMHLQFIRGGEAGDAERKAGTTGVCGRTPGGPRGE